MPRDRYHPVLRLLRLRSIFCHTHIRVALRISTTAYAVYAYFRLQVRSWEVLQYHNAAPAPAPGKCNGLVSRGANLVIPVASGRVVVYLVCLHHTCARTRYCIETPSEPVKPRPRSAGLSGSRGQCSGTRQPIKVTVQGRNAIWGIAL